MIYKIEGDVTKADLTQGDTVIIAHVCNNRGGWGAGVSGAIGKAFPAAEIYYHGFMTGVDLFEVNSSHLLGTNLVVPIKDNIIVVNMIAQDGYASLKNPVAINMDALDICLKSLYELAVTISEENAVSIHLPKIGSGLGGGNWVDILEYIEFYGEDNDVVDTYIYEYIPASSR